MDGESAKLKVWVRIQENTTLYNITFSPYLKGAHIFPEIWEEPQNSKGKAGDTRHLPYSGPKKIKHATQKVLCHGIP